MVIKTVGGPHERKKIHYGVSLADGIIFQDEVRQFIGYLPRNNITLVSRPIRGQRKGSMILDRSTSTPRSGNVPKRPHHNNNVRNSKILPHHGIFMFIDYIYPIHMSATKVNPAHMI